MGCAEIVSTVDNLSGPTAIANLHTLINEGINGFVDFQVLSAYQPAMAKILKAAKIPAVTVVVPLARVPPGGPGPLRLRDRPRST